MPYMPVLTTLPGQVRKTAMREVKVLQNVRHDNVVRLLDSFRLHRKLYLVFEFVEGTVLQVNRCPCHTRAACAAECRDPCCRLWMFDANSLLLIPCQACKPSLSARWYCKVQQRM